MQLYQADIYQNWRGKWGYFSTSSTPTPSILSALEGNPFSNGKGAAVPDYGQVHSLATQQRVEYPIYDVIGKARVDFNTF